MTNWRELGEQRRNPGGRVPLPDLKDQQAQRALILEKLALFDEFDVAQKLEEIKRQIWKSRGQVVKNAPQLTKDEKKGFTRGETSCGFWVRDIFSFGEEWEDITRTVSGPYRVFQEHQGGGDSSRLHNGGAIESIGSKLVAVNSGQSGCDGLSIRMAYSLEGDIYRLVTGKNFSFNSSSINRAAIAATINDGLVDYSVKALNILEKESRDKAEYERKRGLVGTVSPHDPRFIKLL